MSIDSIKIRRKLQIIVALLLIPIALLAWLFVQQSFKDIDFAKKERDGVAYVSAAWPVLKALIIASNDPRTMPAGLMRSAQDIAALGKAYDQAMESGDAARALSEALRGLGWPDRALARNADTEKAIAAARALVGKISDGSNLTLDPDLDSFYVMDIITTKLTEVVDREGTLLALAGAERTAPSLSDDDKAELMIQLGQLEGALSGASASLDSAYKGNPDGAVRKNLDTVATAFVKSSGAFDAEMKTVAVALRNDATRSKIDLTRLTTLASESMTTTDAFWQAAARDLDRLLAARNDGFSMRLWTMLGIAGAVVAFALTITFYIARRIASQLQEMGRAMHDLAEGKLDTRMPDVKGKDEVGVMAEALHILRSGLEQGEQLNAERKQLDLRSQDDRKSSMRRLADEFEAAVGNIIDMVTSSATELEAAAGTLTTTAETTQQLSGSVAAASEEASASVQSVAVASEELAGSVSEIARQVLESSKIANEAVKQAEKTDARIGQLSQAAGRIGDVVKLITGVAEQTNLLALNATIEAARAGDAGKGFAVVAHEVKALAAQTAKATEEISAQISGMQSATRDSVAAIKEIGTTISRISEIAAAIAAAVEEQGASTQEISRNVAQAAQGTTQVATNITNVNRGASETGSASSQVLTSARSLSNESNRLKLEVDKFLTTVRAA
jgi:methyl-accepting chemotaxis protein